MLLFHENFTDETDMYPKEHIFDVEGYEYYEHFNSLR